MAWQDRIITDSDVLVGKSIVKGTRLAVEVILGLLADGWSQEEVIRSYPRLTGADVRACLAYDAASVT